MTTMLPVWSVELWGGPHDGYTMDRREVVPATNLFASSQPSQYISVIEHKTPAYSLQYRRTGRRSNDGAVIYELIRRESTDG